MILRHRFRLFPKNTQVFPKQEILPLQLHQNALIFSWNGKGHNRGLWIMLWMHEQASLWVIWIETTKDVNLINETATKQIQQLFLVTSERSIDVMFILPQVATSWLVHNGRNIEKPQWPFNWLEFLWSGRLYLVTKVLQKFGLILLYFACNSYFAMTSTKIWFDKFVDKIFTQCKEPHF